MAALKSYLDLVNDCDKFPYDDPLTPRDSHWNNIYTFHLANDHRPHGLLLSSTINSMPWTSDFKIDHTTRKVHLIPHPSRDPTTPPTPQDIAAARTTALTNLIQECITQNTFRVLDGRHSEPYPIIGANTSPSNPITLERYAAPLFGIISRGAHLTVYTTLPRGEIKIWVARRSLNCFTYPGCLDTSVAGGVSLENPFECVVREAEEEASLSEDLVRKGAKACGCISYIGINGARGGGEEGLISPNVLYVYDLEVGAGVECMKGDDEVGEFMLMGVDEVEASLRRGEWKTNSAVVMIDWFVRHGVVTGENEGDYVEILGRMHRRLPLPTRPSHE